jgi:uncharacterized protein YdaU (DUF1376 family)
MSAIVHVPFYPSDWLSGTIGLSAAERGVYITLIAMMYERAGAIKSDDLPRLARACGTSASALKSILDRLIDDGKITRDDGEIYNQRVDLEVKKVLAKSKVASDNVKARWGKNLIKSTDDEYGRNTDGILVISHKSYKEKNTNFVSVTKESLEPQIRKNEGSNPPPDFQKPIENSEPPKPAPKPPRSRGERIPDDWEPDLEFAISEGLNAAEAKTEAAKFRDYWIAKSGNEATKLDWGATWRNWCRNSRSIGKKNARPPPYHGTSRVTASQAIQKITQEFEALTRGNQNVGDDYTQTIDGSFATDASGNSENERGVFSA